MHFRLSKQLWELVLLFSPALVISLATIAGILVLPRRPSGDFTESPEISGAVYGTYVAIPLSLALGWYFTTPSQKWFERAALSVVAAILVLILNVGVAFAGCYVVGR